jgi:hypothetical protein
MLNDSEQSAPQLIPAGLESTWPAIPVLLTVSTKRWSSKAAVAVLAPVIISVHVTPDTESHPFHPVKLESPAALAVRVTSAALA